MFHERRVGSCHWQSLRPFTLRGERTPVKQGYSDQLLMVSINSKNDVSYQGYNFGDTVMLDQNSCIYRKYKLPRPSEEQQPIYPLR